MLTAAQIQEALLKVPVEERVALAAKLLATVRLDGDDTIDEPLPELSEDRDRLLTHLREKRSRHA